MIGIYSINNEPISHANLRSNKRSLFAKRLRKVTACYAVTT
ncbi:hypothetical protein [Frederiksenia canicola]|nr:hypothetical protein [Frederiksenia canicola]